MMRSAPFLLMMALAACGSSPKTEFYTLVPVAPTTTARVDIKGPPIQVGRVDLPSILDRPALVIQGTDAHVIVSDQDRWAGPLDTLVRQALSDDLRSRLGTAAVLAAGDPAPAGKARQLLVVIERFSADSAGRVVLKADWTMGSGNPPRPGAIHHQLIEENAGSTEAGPVTAAMSRALGRLADDIAQAA
jgi:uncharacterized lipoprotein YmbA